MLAAAIVLGLAGVVWEAPAGCPDAAFVEARLHAYVDAEFAATVRVIEIEGRYEASVDVEAAGGTNHRTLRADDCTTLADAVALVIAVDVDVLAVASHPGVREVIEGPEPEPAVPPPIAPPPVIVDDDPIPVVPGDDAPTATPPRARAFTIGLRLDAGVGIGALPRPNFLTGLTAAIRWRRWRWELMGAHHFERPARLDPPNENAGADIRLWTATARARFVPSVRIVEFPFSVGVELGDMIGEGVGVTKQQTRHRLWAAGLLGAGLAVVPHPRVALWLDPSLVLAFAQPGFGVETRDRTLVAYQPGVPGFRATFALEARI